MFILLLTDILGPSNGNVVGKLHLPKSPTQKSPLKVVLFFYLDFSLHVSLYYRETLVKAVTTTSPEGCRITSSSSSSAPSSPSSSSPSSPCQADRFLSRAEVILFPQPYPESHRQGAAMLPNVLERGVLLWMTPEGLYAKCLCQGRVGWEGPTAAYSDKANTLEKEQPCKVFDTQQFLVGKPDLCSHQQVYTQLQAIAMEVF